MRIGKPRLDAVAGALDARAALDSPARWLSQPIEREGEMVAEQRLLDGVGECPKLLPA